MKRRAFFYKLASLPFVGFLFNRQIQAATITDATATRIIVDLLKDRTVANDVPYNTGADLAPATVVNKYAIAFWTVYNGKDNFTPGTPVPTPTNAQLAAFMLRKLKHHCREVYEQSVIPVAAAATAATTKATVDAETTTDLGVP